MLQWSERIPVWQSLSFFFLLFSLPPVSESHEGFHVAEMNFSAVRNATVNTVQLLILAC